MPWNAGPANCFGGQRFRGSVVRRFTLSTAGSSRKVRRTLYALNPDSGEILWTFCPYGPSGETMYSSPTAHGQSIFIGDRRGILYCLDVRTGGTQWQRRTNKAKNDDVNSTPLIRAGLVIVERTRIGQSRMMHEPESWPGSKNWTALPHSGHCCFTGLRPSLQSPSIYWNSKPAKWCAKYSWKDDSITVATSTPRKIVGTLSRGNGTERKRKLVGVNKDRIQYSTVQNIWWWAMRYARETNLGLPFPSGGCVCL